MSYIGQGLEQAYSERYVFTAAGGETSVSVADDGRTVAYVIGQVDVYKNGLRLVSGNDFSASSGTSITGLATLSAGDVVEIVAYAVVIAPDAVSASAGGTFQDAITVQGAVSATGVVSASGGSSTDWNTAYAWGNHASAGYLTSFTETDPVFSASAASGISSTNITNWNTAYGWGDHASAGYQAASTALTTSTTFGGDVSGNYNAIVIADDSHNHVISNVDGLQSALNAKQDASTALTTSTTFGGDVSGTYNAIAVANDSHTHDGRYYTESEADSRFVNVTGDTITSGGNTALTINHSTFGNGLVLERADSTNSSSIKFTNTAGTAGVLYGRHTDNELVWRDGTSTNNHMLWHEGNDGSGSGLDADTVDGLHASSFLRDAADSEQTAHFGTIFWNESAVRVNSDPRANEPGYNADNINIHWWTTTAAGANYGQMGHALYNGSDYQYLHTKASQNHLYINNNVVWNAGNDGAGSGLDADLLDGVQGSSYLRSDQSDTMSGNLTLDNGTSTTLSVKCDDSGLALIRANGDGQGTGAIEVGQSNDYGGGISYNGDGSPSFVSGETSDAITFYRMESGTRSEVFAYPYNSDTVTFNGAVNISGNISAGSSGTTQHLREIRVGSNVGATNQTGIIKNGGSTYGLGLFTWGDSVPVFIGGSAVNLRTESGVGIPLQMNGTTVIDSSRNLTNISSISVTAGGSYPLQVSSTQRYQIQILNPNNTTQSSWGWWLATDTNFNFVLHADGSGDKLTLTRAGDMTLTGGLVTNGNVNANSGVFATGGTTVIDGSRNMFATRLKATTAVQPGSLGYWKLRDNNGGSELTAEYSTSDALSDANIRWRVNTAGTTYQIGEVRAQGDIRSGGQVRATGWYNGNSTNYSGLAFEIGTSSGEAYALSYNRDTSSYGYMNFDATGFRFRRSDVRIDYSLHINNAGTGNNRIYFNGYRAMEGDNGALLQIGEGYSLTKVQSNLEVDAGRYTEIVVKGDDNGTAQISLYGDNQGTGRVYVGQSNQYGGGIEYNGDGSPATTGGGADYVILYRTEGGTSSWTARNYYSSNDWQFRGNVTAYASDARLKENVTTITDALEKVQRLRGVEFDWKDECAELGFMPSMQHETGVIAQEVQAVIPDAAYPAPFNKEYLTVQKDKIVPLLIEAIKEQQEQIDELRAQLKEIKNGNH